MFRKKGELKGSQEKSNVSTLVVIRMRGERSFSYTDEQTTNQPNAWTLHRFYFTSDNESINDRAKRKKNSQRRYFYALSEEKKKFK